MENRNIFLFGETNEQNLLPIINQIVDINEQDNMGEQMVNGFTRQPIRLFINSNGGNMHDGFALVDIMLNSRTPVITYCIGKCYSMGFILFICGHQRFIGENATCMYHQMSFGVDDCLQGVEDIVELSKKFQSKIHKIVTDKTKIKMAQIDKCNKNKEDWFIHFDEAVKLGVADYVYEG